METIAQPYQREVAKGAAWLDENRPGWEFKLDLAELNLSSAQTCVLGRVDGNFWESLSKTHRNGDDGAHFELLWAAERGFFVGIENSAEAWRAYNQLTDAWRNFIKHRFDKGIFSGPPEWTRPAT
jgi:hypothetical protein